MAEMMRTSLAAHSTTWVYNAHSERRWPDRMDTTATAYQCTRYNPALSPHKLVQTRRLQALAATPYTNLMLRCPSRHPH